MRIAVDFDGTIVQHRYPYIGDPLPYAFDVLARLTAEGHKIILYSVREGELLDEAVEFCRDHGLEFYAVNGEEPEHYFNSARKIFADVYIDDRNIGGLPDWPQIYKMLSEAPDVRALKKSVQKQNQPPRERKPLLIVRLLRRCRQAREKLM